MRKEKINENNSVHFLFEKTNNSDVNPDIQLRDQNPAVIERLLKNIKRKNLNLYSSSQAAYEGQTFIKYTIEQHGNCHSFFTFSIAETKLDWIRDKLMCYYEYDESIFNLRKNKMKDSENLQTIELTAQYSVTVVDIFVQLMNFLMLYVFGINPDG